MLHPLKKLKKARGLTYREIAAHVRESSGEDTPTDHTIIAIATGQFNASPRMADKIHNAFPEVSREDLIYFSITSQ